MEETGTNSLSRELAEYRASEFIEDGTKLIICCSACKEDLVEIWMLRPNAPIVTEMVVECPFCGDKSFKETIAGQFALGRLESRKVSIIDMPTKISPGENGTIIQEVLLKTQKREL